MASTIYWYPPRETPALKTVSLSYAFTGLQDHQFEDLADESATFSGRVYRVTRYRRRRVRVLYERTTDPSDARELEAVSRHLAMGGAIGLAHDATKAWGGAATRPPRAGDTSITLRSSDAGSWFGTSPSLAAGDEVVLTSTAPDGLTEILRVASQSGSTVTLSESVRIDYPEDYPVIVRQRDFFPALVLPTGGTAEGMLTSENRLTWTFNAPLVEDRQVLAALGIYDYLRPPTASPGLPTLDDLRGGGGGGVVSRTIDRLGAPGAVKIR